MCVAVPSCGSVAQGRSDKDYCYPKIPSSCNVWLEFAIGSLFQLTSFVYCILTTTF